MNKKIVFIIVLVILILIIFGIYNSSNDKNENEITNNVTSENIVENSQENTINNEDKNIENTTTTEEKDNNTNKTILDQVSPTGFMGSSLYRVILYSNGEAYVEKFDGNGYEQKNIISNDLIAKNVDSIQVATDDENYGQIIIKGGEPINHNYGWIDFK